MDPVFIPAAISLGSHLLDNLTTPPTRATNGPSFAEAMKEAEANQKTPAFKAIPQPILDQILQLPEIQQAIRTNGLRPETLRFSPEGKLGTTDNEGRFTEIPLSPDSSQRVRELHTYVTRVMIRRE